MSDKSTKVIALEENVLSENDKVAREVRASLAAKGQYAINFMSSPGSGKTTMLCETMRRIKDFFPVVVIEGDQQTSNDAERIRQTGVRAHQINTGENCHLEAYMVRQAMDALDPEEGAVVFIENVGNLVCPAAFDLGESLKVVVLSVTEGDDKPLKYPYMFMTCDVMLVTKTDLAPYVDFDIPKCIEAALSVNPKLKVFTLSSKTKEGFEEWVDFLKGLKKAV